MMATIAEPPKLVSFCFVRGANQLFDKCAVERVLTDYLKRQPTRLELDFAIRELEILAYDTLRGYRDYLEREHHSRFGCVRRKARLRLFT